MTKRNVNKEHVEYIQLGKAVFAIRARNFDTEFETFRMIRGSWTLIGSCETPDHAYWMIVDNLRVESPVVTVKRLP